MRDHAFTGSCLICGKTCYGQSECDTCADGSSDNTCPECGDIADKTKPLKDCLDHMDEGEVRKEARRLKAQLNAKFRQIAELIDRLKFTC